MIIYIHGFGGSGQGVKAKLFREYFKSTDEGFIAPSLAYVPELAITTLEELIESYNGDVKLIGSSLGGFYSMYLAKKYNLKAALINPAVTPEVTLQRTLGQTLNYYDGSFFEWKKSHLEMLKNYSVDISDQSRFMLLVQKDDEVLDYKDAVSKLPDAKIVAEEGGSHSFDGIERYFDNIRVFLNDIK
jgi:predicted esterase YcpF (UPF0227 family)